MKKIKNNKRKNIIIKLLKKQKGSEIITIPIVIALGLLILSTLIVFSVKILMPYIWYEKLSSTCLKYIFVMEEYGYLTSKEKQSLTNELIKQGFNKENLKIYCTDKRQRYGNPIYLNVNYNYNLELPLIGTKNILMNINRESVSKR